jgi:hypothetical protein
LRRAKKKRARIRPETEEKKKKKKKKKTKKTTKTKKKKRARSLAQKKGPTMGLEPTYVGMSKRLGLYNKEQESTSHQAALVTGRTGLIYTRHQDQAMELIQDVIQKMASCPIG